MKTVITDTLTRKLNTEENKLAPGIDIMLI